MEKLYAMLIQAGRRTIDNVPQSLRDKVIALLEKTEG